MSYPPDRREVTSFVFFGMLNTGASYPSYDGEPGSALSPVNSVS
jgi:hypothetical protein